MAETPKKPAKGKPAKAKPVEAKPSDAETPTPTERAAAAAERRRLKANQRRRDAAREKLYLANKGRVDEALAACIRHFGGAEYGVVEIVCWRLFDYYRTHRAEIPKVKAGGGW